MLTTLEVDNYETPTFFNFSDGSKILDINLYENPL